MSQDPGQARRGRQIALLIAALGVFWILVTAIGAQYGWSQRTRALFDLVVLAGFGLAIWMIYQLWRKRQNHKD